MPEARELTFGEAVREALAEEMRRDPRVFICGEDIAEAGTVFKVLSGLVDEFGTERVLDTPISEAGFTGIAVGAAMTGLRPVVDIMFGDFSTLVMDQMVNQAAKVHYMSGGKWKVPMVMRATLGATRRSAAQHSQSLHAWFCHIPGLKVVLPSTPYDAKGLMKTAIRDENPVVFFEDKMMYKMKGPVPADDYTIPFGVADVKRVGDITIVATSSMVQGGAGRREVARRKTSAPKSSIRACSGSRREDAHRPVKKRRARSSSTRLWTLRRDRGTRIGHCRGRLFNLEAPVKRMGAMHVPIPLSAIGRCDRATEQSVFEAARKMCR
jgi:pyruvate dehydrogenase E1 component beta subunit